ncbi:hypothetical protein [Terrisporobacter sp.]|uniref:hypothetical protein n=1 Tax=Terrisporobacter sp. TaxID=1965305 RepID=UPI00260E0023|nr:hypothetical protein [Terrisporobacter sp.]
MKEEKLSWKERKELKKQEKNKIKQEKKELKEEHKKVQRVVSDLLPFLNVVEDDYFKTKTGYIDIYQIKSKDLNSLNSDEINRHIFEFTSFLRGYTDDLKIISMHYPVNTKVQQEHIQKKIDNTDNPIYIKHLNEKMEELKALEKIRKNKEFYLMLFFKNERDKKEKEIYLNRKLSNAISIKEIDLNKKIKILYKLNNQNSKI